VREKVVAAASARLVILVGPEKLVPALGRRGRLPVEVLPFAISLCQRRFAEWTMPAEVRQDRGQPYVTDNGNPILDLRVSSIADARELDARILSVPGVVGTGLFPGMADVVLVQNGDSVEEKRRAA
jgi:ribose 5-phosphate isomerase A